MKVNTVELDLQSMALRLAAARINEIQSTVLQVSRRLRSERFGERFVGPLNAAVASIDNRGDEINGLRIALQQIASAYEKAEAHIVDEAEHASIHHEFLASGMITLPAGIIYPVLPVPNPGMPIGVQEAVIDAAAGLGETVWDSIRHMAEYGQGAGEGLGDIIGTGNLAENAENILGGAGVIDWTPWDP